MKKEGRGERGNTYQMHTDTYGGSSVRAHQSRDVGVDMASRPDAGSQDVCNRQNAGEKHMSYN